jgi:nitroimidazol reductase NimA-like FMN-containing flavoprotein (pyridoxamine 5'-phosphate oxidase superfamily)
MRRKQCEIRDPERISEILSTAAIGRLATIGADGCPYVTPVNYVYYLGNIYFHCATQGEKLDNMARNPKVCFQVDIPLAYLDAGFSDDKAPCRLHQLYHCVIIRGRGRVVADQKLKTEALNALVAKYEKDNSLESVHKDMPAYKTCKVVEVNPERISAKSDLAQGKPESVRSEIAAYLKKRRRPGDEETIREMEKISKS